ncbi:MAG: 30S ribosomal protein S16 [Dehalococcoidia bacterium]
MLRIRLSRVGKKKQPAYRIVVTDQRNPREGAHLEIIGQYNPLTEPITLKFHEERAVHWLKVGAQPSDTAAKLLTRAGVMELAGIAPFVYKGKEMPAGEKNPKKGRKDEGATPAPVAAAPAAAPAAAVAVAEAPAAEAPAVEAPAAEAPAAEAPAAEAPAEEPVAEAPAAEAPAEEPVAEAPAAEAPAAEEPVTEAPAAEVATEEPVVEEPAAEEAAPAEDTETTS